MVWGLAVMPRKASTALIFFLNLLSSNTLNVFLIKVFDPLGMHAGIGNEEDIRWYIAF